MSQFQGKTHERTSCYFWCSLVFIAKRKKMFSGTARDTHVIPDLTLRFPCILMTWTHRNLRHRFVRQRREHKQVVYEIQVSGAYVKRTLRVHWYFSLFEIKTDTTVMCELQTQTKVYQLQVSRCKPVFAHFFLHAVQWECRGKCSFIFAQLTHWGRDFNARFCDTFATKLQW